MKGVVITERERQLRAEYDRLQDEVYRLKDLRDVAWDRMMREHWLHNERPKVPDILTKQILQELRPAHLTSRLFLRRSKP